MSLALKQASIAKAKDEVPVGAVIVCGDEVVAKAYNQKEKRNLSLAHAEMLCIKKACQKLNTKYLSDCVMYVTLEPCMMCAGALVNSRIKKIYYGTKDPKGGSLESNIKLINIKNINHYPEIEGNILMDECSKILKDYFKSKRNNPGNI